MAYGKRSKISDNLYDYSLMICGESGIGKTAVISEVCEKEFGEDGYLLLNTGDEEGVSAIDDVTYEDVPNFKKFVEICNDIIKNKKTEYPNLKVMIIDTLDQLIDLTQKKAIENWNRENMKNKNFKKAKTLKSVEGGFGAGYDVVFNMIYDQVRALRKVGVRVWYTCHSKTKDIVDPVTSASYTILTSNLVQRYFNDFKTKVHIVGVACLDRSIEAEGTGRKDIITKKEITVNKIKDEKRKIVFRDDSYSVDSKSRFSGIVDEIPLDSDELIKALKDAIQNSKKKKKVVKPNPQPELEDEIEEDIDDVIEDDITEADEDLMEDVIDDIDEDTSDDYPEDLREHVKELCKTCEDAELKTKVKGIIKQYGKLSEVDDDGLKEMYDLLK